MEEDKNMRNKKTKKSSQNTRKLSTCMRFANLLYLRV